MAEGLTTLKQHRCFGGTQGVYRHQSSATRCAMEFAVYEPPHAARAHVPVLYWLSGLTCTWANFTEKAGAQRYAAEHGLIIVAPACQGRRVGHRLMTALLEGLEDCTVLLHATSEGRGLYERLGFVRTGEIRPIGAIL